MLGLWQQQFEIIKEIASKEMQKAGTVFSISALDRFLNLETKRARYWDRGQRPTASDLVRISDKLGISLRWLITGEGEPHDSQQPAPTPPPPRANSPIRMVGLASCGVVGWNQIMPVAVSASAPEVGDKAVAVIAFGESMVPAGISSGQVCYADPGQAPLQGDAVYVARRDGLATVKLYLGEGERAGWVRLKGWLDPDQDGQRKPFFVDMPKDQIETIAPVIYVRRRL